MKFCKYCGGEISDHAKFCKHCGSNLTGENNADEAPRQNQEDDTKNKEEPVDAELQEKPVAGDQEDGKTDDADTTPEQPSEQLQNQGGIGTSKNNVPSQPRKKMSMKSKIFIGLGALVLVLLIVVYQLGSSMTSKEKVLENFEDAVVKKDAETAAEFLKVDHKDISVNKDSVQGFVDYYSDHPSDFDHAMEHLKEQSEQYDSNPESAKARSETNSDLYALNLMEDGKKFGIYNDYAIQVSPVYFEVETDLENTEILMDGEVVATSDSEDFSKKVGPFLPGTYQFTAVYKDDYVELTAEEEASSFDPGVPEYADLSINADELSFYSRIMENIDNAKLFINGDDTGVNIAEQESFGPITTDGSMTVALEAEFPWGSTKTDEVPIDDTLMDVEFKLNEDQQEEAKNTIIKYNQELMAVRTTASKKKFTTATDDVVDEVVETAKSEKERDYYYKGKFIGIDFYTESFDIEQEGNTWHVNVDTVPTFEADSWYGDDNEPNLHEIAEGTRYELIYDTDDDAWKVNNVGWPGQMDDDKMEKHKEEDPKTYTSEWLD